MRFFFLAAILVLSAPSIAEPILYQKDTPDATTYLVIDDRGEDVSFSVCGERKRDLRTASKQTPKERPEKIHCACGDDKDVVTDTITTSGQSRTFRRNLQWNNQVANLQCEEPGCDVCILFCPLDLNGDYQRVGPSSFKQCESGAFR